MPHKTAVDGPRTGHHILLYQLFMLCSIFEMSIGDTKSVRKKDRPGRGAAINPTSRFDAETHVDFDDGWGADDPDPQVLRTRFQMDASRTILARNSSPDISFDRSVNPYRGCEHGCIYCFARPTHAYLGLSPGLDFETEILVKPRAAELLKAALSRPNYAPKTIAIGTNTDAYQPCEVKFGVMRGVLEVLRDFNHPVGIVTKGALIRRDVDILGAMGHDGLAAVGISLTTLDAKLSRKMEPRAAAPAMRLKMIEALTEAGCPVRVMIAPVIPGLTDHELEALLQAGKDAGAQSASYIAIRMPLEVSVLFRAWLEEHFPSRAKKIIRSVRSFHGGKDYDPKWGTRMSGTGREAELLAARFTLAVKKLGLGTRLTPLRRDLFKVPGRAQQLSLF